MKVTMDLQLVGETPDSLEPSDEHARWSLTTASGAVAATVDCARPVGPAEGLRLALAHAVASAQQGGDES